MSEFDCEIVLFQSAFRNIQDRIGKEYMLLDFIEAKQHKNVIRQTFKDIKHIREDESLSSEVAAFKDKKLVAGMLLSLLRYSNQWLNHGKMLSTYSNVYPHFDWGLYLRIINVCNWENHLLQCLEAVQIKVLLQATKKIFAELTLCSTHSLVPFLIKITVILMHPKKIEEFIVTSKLADGYEYKKFIKKLIELLKTLFRMHIEWSKSLKEKFVLALLEGAVQVYLNLWKNNCIYSSENCISLSKRNILNEDITSENLELVYSLIQEGSNQLNMKLFEDKFHIDIMIMYFEFCHHVFTDDILEEFVCSLSVEEESPLPHEKSEKIKKLVMNFNKYCEEFDCLGVNSIIEIHDIAVILNSLNNKLGSFLLEPLNLNVDSPNFDVVESIDRRCINYRGDIAFIIEHPEFIYTKDWISCVERNLDLLDYYDVYELLLQIKDRNLQSPNVERIKLVIHNASLKWPKILQEKFLFNYLTDFSEQKILELQSFSVDVTSFFNKSLKTDTTVTLDKMMLDKFWLLCLQSVQKTILTAICNAVNNESQIDVIIELISSVPILFSYCIATSTPTFLCQNIYFYLMSNIFTDVQSQNFILFLIKLVKTNGTYIEDPSLSMPILKPLDLFQTCILPFLNKWVPESSSKLSFALQLFEEMIKDSLNHKYEWLSEIQLNVILCYLCIIIYQCKLICTTDECEWITIKSQAIAVIQKILTWMFRYPQNITDTEMQWLIKKLQSIHEPSLFYLVDLLEFHNYQGNFIGTNDPVTYLLEFGICSEKNAQAVVKWFLQVTKSLKKSAWAQVTSALVKVLPFCLMNEWKNLITILKYSFENEQLLYPKEVHFTFSHSEDSQVLLSLLCILEKAIILCNALQNNLKHMLHCFTLMVKEQLEVYINMGLEDEDRLITAEIFIKICYLIKRFSPLYNSDGGVLLLELTKINVQDFKHTKIIISRLRKTLRQVPPFEMYNSIDAMLL